MKDKFSGPAERPGANSAEELGPNTDIGAKLRALYGAVQEEAIPDKFLDLLEKLDSVERAADKSDARS